MNRIIKILSFKKLFFIVLLFIGGGMFILAPKAAVNVDEQLHYPYAKKVVNWYFTGGKDKSCLNTPKSNLKYYGQSVDNITALINRIFKVKDEFLIRHYTGAIFFLLLLLFSGILTYELTGSWFMAIVTLFSLVFMPRLAGQAYGNLKDIPFATGYMAGILMIVRLLKEMPKVKWGTSVILGLSIAFTVSVRSGGFILLFYFFIGVITFFILKPFYLKQIISTKSVFVRFMGQGMVILLIGYIGGLLFWPYALQNILRNPMESLMVMQHYKVSIRQIFEGEMMWSTQLPWYYLLKWMVITTPLFVIIGLAIYFCSLLKQIITKKIKRKSVYHLFVLFTVAFPVFYVICINSNLYSGVRQMLFVFSPMAILAVIGLGDVAKWLFKKKMLYGYLFSITGLVVLILPVQYQVSNFPVDYVYFNPLTGGNKGAWGNYEYDYYFHAVKEPVMYLKKKVDNDTVTVAMNCNLSNYFEKDKNIKYQYSRFVERSSYDWDYAIFGLNYIEPYMLKQRLWMKESGVEKVFYHMGNPIAILLKRKTKDDFYGIAEINRGNFNRGIDLLEGALKNDSNNLWLYVNLAKAKLKKHDIKGFEAILSRGKEIYSDYEPFLFLEAMRFYCEENYKKANEKLDYIIAKNSYYYPAIELKEKIDTLK